MASLGVARASGRESGAEVFQVPPTGIIVDTVSKDPDVSEMPNISRAMVRLVPQLTLPLRARVSTSKRAKPEGMVHRVTGLFAGVGGLERGLHRSGHESVLLAESDPAARAVLAQRFPDVRLDGDVRTLRNLPVDTTLVAAGFPCQDLSQAGSTNGISGARSGLVGEVLRLVEAHQTPWVLLENVPFMLQLGHGEAMHVLTSAFDNMGYDWAYRVVNAQAFGLPQRRRRVYFLASLRGDPRSILFADEATPLVTSSSTSTRTAYGFYWTEGVRGLGWAVGAVPTLKGGSGLGIPSSPALLLSNGNVVTLDIRDAERLQGFPADWTRAAESVAKKGVRWKLVGNAVSVPAAAWIGRRMLNPGEPLNFSTLPMGKAHRWPNAAWNVGQGAMRIQASEWPVCYRQRSIEDFMQYQPSMLSAKATSGFLRRTERAKLRFPAGFLEAVRRHLDVVSTGVLQPGAGQDDAALPRAAARAAAMYAGP